MKNCTSVLATVLLVCIMEKCSAFSLARVMSGILRPSAASSSSRRNASNRDFLHEAEYPGDDFTHILGYSDCDHQSSKLQEIAANTLRDVARNKLPVDTVSSLPYSYYFLSIIMLSVSFVPFFSPPYFLPSFLFYLLHVILARPFLLPSRFSTFAVPFCYFQSCPDTLFFVIFLLCFSFRTVAA